MLQQVQRPSQTYLRDDIKPLTQMGCPRAAEWLRLARAGHLTYMVRHMPPLHGDAMPSLLDGAPRLPTHDAQERRWKAWQEGKQRLLALHWMCTYIDALCVPVLDEAQKERIRVLSKMASGYWYAYLPARMHTLLVHAMLHLAQQALHFGPQCIFWLFHKER